MSSRWRSAALAAVSFAWLGAAAGQSGQSAPVGDFQGSPLKALSSNGVRVAVAELVPQCERSVGRAVSIEYGTSASIRQRIRGGEAVDFALITAPVVAELVQGGHLAASSVVPMGRAGIGVGVRAGARKPDVATAASIKQTLLAAKSVTFAREGASRTYLERMFGELGIAAEMQAKTLLEAGSVQAAHKVAAGEAELLLTLVSEILPDDGVELVGPLPAEFQSYISFEAALGAQPRDFEAARAFVACLSAPSATATYNAKGIER
jgi:molybdate transport system substrate-binding protein